MPLRVAVPLPGIISGSAGTEARRQKDAGVPADKAPGPGQEEPIWECSLLLGLSKVKSSHLRVPEFTDCREQAHGMRLRKRGLDLEGSSRRSCGSPCTNMHMCLEPAADLHPLGDQSWLVSRARHCPATAPGEGGGHLLSSSSSLARPQDALAAGSHGDKEPCCRW